MEQLGMWHMVNQHLLNKYQELTQLNIKMKKSETLQLSLVMLILSFSNVLNVHHHNVIKHFIQEKRILPDANIVIIYYFWRDIFHLLIAQVTMFSWLQCLQVLLSWTLHFFLLQEMNHVRSRKQVSILQQLKLWNLKILSFFRTKLILSLKTKMHALDNKNK